MSALTSSGALGTTTWWISGIRDWTSSAEKPKISAGASTVPVALPWLSVTFRVTFAMIYQAPFTAERTRTMLPFGPGMAPLMASTPFSTSDETMVRFSVVLVT